MANYLKMKQRQQVIALLELGWTYRRIEAETGVRRETVSRYDRLRRSNAAKVFPGSDHVATAEGSSAPPEAECGSANPAKVFPGSRSSAAKVFAGSGLPPQSTAAPYRDAILEKLDRGLSLQRISQDLVGEYGYGGSYESVKRFARGLKRPRRAVGVYHSAPGEEAQVDFFRGAPTFRAESGQWERPWVFRMTLCHSRHGFEEAAWDQKLETFLRLHENAFVDLGGVPQVVREGLLIAPSQCGPPAKSKVAASRDGTGGEQKCQLICAPNPFNPRTTFNFSLPTTGHVQVAIYDAKGQMVAELVDESMTVGAHTVDWDGRNAYGAAMPSGPYFCRLETPRGVAMRKLQLVR